MVGIGRGEVEDEQKYSGIDETYRQNRATANVRGEQQQK
jgi:hypothetical protein